MSPDTQIAALTVQVAWLTEQLQAQLRPVVPTKLVLTVPELAARWGRGAETIRRMIRKKSCARCAAIGPTKSPSPRFSGSRPAQPGDHPFPFPGRAPGPRDGSPTNPPKRTHDP